MGKWKKPKGRERRWNRSALIRRDGMVCGMCQEPIASLDDLSIDHIQPVSKGGTDKLENLRLTHIFCNSQRGDGFFTQGGSENEEATEESEPVD